MLQIARYGVVGVTSVAIYVGGIDVLLHWGLPQVIANFAAYALATAWNYLLNYYWSFRSTRSHRQAGTRFMTVVLVGLVANSVFVALASQVVPVVWAGLAFALLWPMASFSALRLWAMK